MELERRPQRSRNNIVFYQESDAHIKENQGKGRITLEIVLFVFNLIF